MASCNTNSTQNPKQNHSLPVKNERKISSNGGREVSNYEFISEDDLNILSEEQLDELLEQARDVNKRLKDYEIRKHCHENTSLLEEKSTKAQSPKSLLPPINTTRQNSLVTKEHVIENFSQSRKSNKEQVQRLKTKN